jgi:ribosomal protein S18 acetylase RimI-like enzyme
MAESTDAGMLPAQLADLTRADAGPLAQLHQRCFESYFLTQMGTSFLKRYYAEYGRHDFDYGVLAWSRAAPELLGFVAGTANAPAHFRSFYRRHLPVLGCIVCWKLLTNRIVRGTILQRMAHLRAALRAMLPGAPRAPTAPISDHGPETQCPLRLLVIAVAPEARGSGVAGELMQAFENKLRTAGHRRVGLSVRPDNARAIAFYSKCGWTVTHSSKAGVWFERDL